MPRDDYWPEFCSVIGCTDPFLRPHHHHNYKGFPARLHCTCGNIDLPGTKPKDEQ